MDDATLWEQFTTTRLPASEWTHHAHLRVAWMFLERHPLDEAHILMRVGIVNLNAFHGLVETPTRGYHETMTRAWLTIVAACKRDVPADDSLSFIARCTSRVAKEAILRHYSRELLLGTAARARFLEPDLTPF